MVLKTLFCSERRTECNGAESPKSISPIIDYCSYFHGISTSTKYQREISSKGPSFLKGLQEVYQFRYLLFSFATRDYKVRYAQTLLGYSWSLIQPLASVAVLFLVFKKMMGIEADGIGYLPFVMSGLLLWNYFNFVISQSASALLNAQNMIRKIYFPKICLPLSKAIVGLVAPLVGFFILIALLSQEPSTNWFGVLYFFPALLITSLAAMGVGLWTSALSIRFRDLQQIIPYVLQILFFLTPIAYSSQLANSLFPESWGFLLYLNPMTGIIESFRSILFNTPTSDFLWISIAVSLVLFITGLRYFQKIEIKIADII